MRSYVDMSLEAYPDTISKFCLTGGECMLLGKDVDRILSYAKGKGLKCSMVSNAFWATDYDKATAILKRLKRNGLRMASFSTGEDHNKHVPWMNVRNASVAAARLGLESELRIEDQPGRMEIFKAIDKDEEITALVSEGKLKISRSSWMHYNNKGRKARNWKVDFYDTGKRDRCTSLFSDIIINPYGEMYACCGIGVCHIPQMRLGNVNTKPVKDIYERAFDDFLKVWLFTDGPQEILKYVHGKTGQKFNCHTMHHCDICRVIFTDRTIIPLIRDNFFDAADLPLISYKAISKKENEERGGR